MSGGRLTVWAAAILVCIAAEPAFAQGLTAINGYIKDQSGAVVPNLEVTVTNKATGLPRIGTSNVQGWYSVTLLLPGTYTVSAKSPGFNVKPVSLPLPVDEVVRLDLLLEVGTAPPTTIDVVTGLNTTNAQLGTAFDSQTILDLPSNARNIGGLLLLDTGVTLSDKAGEFERDDGGQVNGARNDQQNTVLDSININQQERGGAVEGALPVTLDSVQEFVVQTAGFGGQAGRGSGAQMSLVTKSGSNAWHGSVYDYYRTTGTSAKNYFAPEATPLIRHLPGFSLGGPIRKNKLFFFGAYEYNSDRSGMLQTRTVPTPELLNGTVRYQRKDGTFGTLTDGPGGGLALLTGIPDDRWNSAVIGPNGIFEQYRPFSMDTSRTSPGDDNGANFLTYRFNAPFNRDRNIYISRIDYNINRQNTVYVRGTLNDDVRTLVTESFPGFDNERERIDNSKGFAANWNSVLAWNLISNFSFGLTRESFEDTGVQSATYAPPRLSKLIQTTGASRQAIDTWNFVETLSWVKGNHVVKASANYRFIDNLLRSSEIAAPPTYSGPANLTGNGIGSSNSPGLRRALGEEEFNNVVDPGIVGDAIMAATGSVSQFLENVQFDVNGNKLPAGTPFVRNFALHEWDFAIEDAWKLKPNLTLSYGLHYSLATPPYERNGVQVNWVEDLGQRWRQMRDTTETIDKFPLFSVQSAGRANNMPDFYKMDTNNWAPRVSVAWLPGFEDGILGFLTKSGGQMVVRAGYAMSYDRMGGRFGRDAATFGSIGLLTRNALPPNSLSLDGLNSIPRAPRVGTGVLPEFPFSNQPNSVLPSAAGGAGPGTTTGIDAGLHSPADHLLNFTITKELPSGWVVEASYVGRFARDLIGQVDISSPLNLRDSLSGTTLYEATHELFTRYLENRVPTEDVQPIAWYENAYPEMKTYVEGRLGRSFASATQAWYAYMLQQSAAPGAVILQPGPNAPVSQVDRLHELESGLRRNKLLSPQVRFFGLFGNFARSNYHSGQFTVRKHVGRGLTTTINYTLSKSMDITSAAEARGVRPDPVTGEGLAADPFNPDFSYALSDFDRRHQLNVNFVADLPFGTGKWLGGGASSTLNQIIGGWQVSSIALVASGRPWNFTASNRFNHHFNGRDQPHVSAPIPFELTKQDRRVFMIPGTFADRSLIATGSFKNTHPGGPIARNQGRGPGFWNVDLAVTKSFAVPAIGESSRLRFRWESFNVFNHPNFATPTTEAGHNIDRSGGTLGEILKTLGTERVMQFSLRLEF
jgi:hypothetical protein